MIQRKFSEFPNAFPVMARLKVNVPNFKIGRKSRQGKAVAVPLSGAIGDARAPNWDRILPPIAKFAGLSPERARRLLRRGSRHSEGRRGSPTVGPGEFYARV